MNKKYVVCCDINDAFCEDGFYTVFRNKNGMCNERLNEAMLYTEKEAIELVKALGSGWKYKKDWYREERK